MQCPSVLSAPTIMGYLYAYNSILQAPTTIRRVDVVMAATPNLASSGQRRRCSTAIIDNESMALMQCPSVLSASTLMGYLYAYNAILQAPHTMRRIDVVLASIANWVRSMISYLKICHQFYRGKSTIQFRSNPRAPKYLLTSSNTHGSLSFVAV